jgi:enoyl-CoA hydratase
MLHRNRDAPDDRLLTLTLDHGKANALDLELVTALDDALAEAEDDGGVRAVLLTGNGRIFCAGVDLRRLVDEDAAYAERFLPALDRLLRRVFTLRKPLVTAAQGHAVAGGALLVMAADTALVADDPERPLHFGIPRLRVPGLFPRVATEILGAAATTGAARDALASGRYLSPAGAVDAGLVDAAVPPGELLPTAGRSAVAWTKREVESFREEKGERLRDVVAAMDRDREREMEETLAVWAAPETRERLRAYLEERVRGRTGS